MLESLTSFQTIELDGSTVKKSLEYSKWLRLIYVPVTEVPHFKPNVI